MKKYTTALKDFGEAIQQLKIAKEAKVSEKQALEILKSKEYGKCIHLHLRGQ